MINDNINCTNYESSFYAKEKSIADSFAKLSQYLGKSNIAILPAIIFAESIAILLTIPQKVSRYFIAAILTTLTSLEICSRTLIKQLIIFKSRTIPAESSIFPKSLPASISIDKYGYRRASLD